MGLVNSFRAIYSGPECTLMTWSSSKEARELFSFPLDNQPQAVFITLTFFCSTTLTSTGFDQPIKLFYCTVLLLSLTWQHSRRKILATPRFEPGLPGRGAWTLPLCYGGPPRIILLPVKQSVFSQKSVDKRKYEISSSEGSSKQVKAWSTRRCQTHANKNSGATTL